jgi:cytochrome c oxidase subunit 2
MLNKLLGIVDNASEHGPLVDHMLEFCHWFMLTLFVGWSVFFLYCLWRFNAKRNPKANYYGTRSHASVHLEFSVVLIEAVLLLGFAIPLWGKRVNPREWPEEDRDKALRVRAIGEQFAWYFHYAGADGQFGRQHALYLENFRPTIVEITSKDVIHSFAIHSMRITQDAIPGSMIPSWFRPIKTGQWEIVCAQLCGAGHGLMRSICYVEDKEAFEGRMKDLAQLRGIPTASEAAPAPAAPAPAPAAQ